VAALPHHKVRLGMACATSPRESWIILLSGRILFKWI